MVGPLGLSSVSSSPFISIPFDRRVSVGTHTRPVLFHILSSFSKLYPRFQFFFTLFLTSFCTLVSAELSVCLMVDYTVLYHSNSC